MGMTLAEKIIANHAGLERVEPGQRVKVKVDRFLMGEKEISRLFAGGEIASLKTPGKLVIALDQFVGSLNNGGIEIIKSIREFSKKNRIHQLYDIGRGGAESIIYPDGGLAKPGDFLAVGPPQLLSLGALGALAWPLEGDELVQALKEDQITIEVPETIRWVFRGKPQRWVGGKDLAIHAWGLQDSEELVGKAVEISGDALEALSISDRLALATFASNQGSRIVLMEPDEKTRVFVRARNSSPFSLLLNDEDAAFADIIEIDAESLEPQVLVPSNENPVLGVSKAKSLQVHQIVIGTGGNGRIEDIRIAAGLLREYKTHPRVRLILIPGSQRVYLHAMEEGLIQIFLRAGAHIGLPSDRYSHQCHLRGLVGKEKCLSTSGYIFPIGDLLGGEIIYGNPAVAAASAVLGRVANPYEMLRTVKRQPTGFLD